MSKKILINSLCGGCLLFFTAMQAQAASCGNFKTSGDFITISVSNGYVVDSMFSPDGGTFWTDNFCRGKSTCEWKYDGRNCPTGNPAAAFSVKFVKSGDPSQPNYAAIGKAVINLNKLKPGAEVSVKVEKSQKGADMCIAKGANYTVVHEAQGTGCSAAE